MQLIRLAFSWRKYGLDFLDGIFERRQAIGGKPQATDNQHIAAWSALALVQRSVYACAKLNLGDPGQDAICCYPIAKDYGGRCAAGDLGKILFGGRIGIICHDDSNLFWLDRGRDLGIHPIQMTTKVSPAHR